MFHLTHHVQDHFKIIWLLSWESKGLPPTPLQCHLGPNPTPQEMFASWIVWCVSSHAKVGSWKSSPLPVPRWQAWNHTFLLRIGTPNVFGKFARKFDLHEYFFASGWFNHTGAMLSLFHSCLPYRCAMYRRAWSYFDEVIMELVSDWRPIFNHPKSVVVTTSSGNSRDIAERKRGNKQQGVSGMKVDEVSIGGIRFGRFLFRQNHKKKTRIPINKSPLNTNAPPKSHKNNTFSIGVFFICDICILHRCLS